MKKKYNYLILFLLVFFLCIENTNAITFRNSGLMYHRDNLDFSWTGDNIYKWPSVYKEYSKDGGKTYNNAFCSDKNFNYQSGTDYAIDSAYKNHGNCKYKVKDGDAWITKTDGDCSKLVGYAIDAAYKEAAKLKNCKNDLNFCKYGYGQAITWTYLALFTPENSYLRKNNKYEEMKYAYDNNPVIRSSIETAWTNYNNDINTGKISTDEKIDQNMYTVGGEGTTNKQFYYVPTSDVCGSAGGEYRTKTTTIKNNKNKTIELTISNQTAGVTLNFPDLNMTATDYYKVELGAGETISFYLSTHKFVGNEGTNSTTAKVKIYGELTEKGTATKLYTTYDSERWDFIGKADEPMQGLILVTTDTQNHTTDTKYKKETNLEYTQNRLQFSKPTISAQDDAQGKCANIATNIEETSKTLQGATCKTINLGNNSFVRIIIGETVRFNYGYLYPSKYESYDKEPVLYAGGGFNLNTNESYAITKYEVAIKWQFADKNLATGKPYFYNAVDIGNTNPETATITYNNTQMTVKEMINKMLLEGEGTDEGILKKYQNLIFEVETYDSNKIKEDGSGIDYTYDFNIYQTAQAKTALNKTFDANNEIKFEINKIELKRYRMKEKKNGTIEYCNDNDEICGNNGFTYRAYFVPMHYSGETFKFNIKKENISLVNEIELNYSGICEIKTEDRFNGRNNGEEGGNESGQSLRYRSITVKNPFPKANSNTGEGIPSNWKDWYMIAANKKRVNDTFTKGAIYILNITDSKMQAIDTYNNNSYYTDWDNIEVSGTSKFVTDIFAGEHKAGSESYCELGVFKESCDK